MGSGQNAHVIRLRGPWRLADGERIKLPATWQDALGGARQGALSRTFHPPTNLTDDDTVILRVASPQQIERILVNGSEVDAGVDLRSLLVESNRLTVELLRHDADATVLDAQLEIASADNSR